MPGHVKHGWIIVTGEAWPLISERAFSLATTTLGEQAPGIPDANTQALADDLETWLQPRAGALSLEVLRQFRNGAWFMRAPNRPGNTQITLNCHLQQLANRYLFWNGNQVTLRMESDCNLAERARRYRWLSLLLPVDLLAAAIAEMHNARLTDCEVHLVTPLLEQLLKSPIAETHYHVGAALRFSELWSSIMRGIAGESFEPPGSATGHPPFGQWRLFQHRLLEAAVTRILLTIFLGEVIHSGTKQTFNQNLPNSAARLMQSETGSSSSVRLTEELLMALSSLQQRAPAQLATTAWLRIAYRRLLGRKPPPATSVKNLLRQDPLFGLLGNEETPPETSFTITALSHIRLLRAKNRPDPSFERTFWQYQRVRCLTFRYLTLEPGTCGLDWFQRHYDRISSLRGQLDGLCVESALRIDSRDACLGASEPRTTPAQEWQKVRNFTREVAQQALAFEPKPGMRRPEIGLIYHFVKLRERRSGRERRLSGDPRDPVFPCRYGSWYSDNLKRARAIEHVLSANPELLLILRGIDVASIEQAVPNWPLLPLLQRVRLASRRAAERMAFSQPTWNVTPLRITLHAGEDFRRLVEGLRRIHEPIEFGVMSVGDRIGHGLALGTDPKLWTETNLIVSQPREERLDDLLWELERYRSGDLPCKAGRIELIRAEIEEHAGFIYGHKRRYDLQGLLNSRRMRHCERWLDYFDYPRYRIIPVDPEQRNISYFMDYLHDGEVFDRGQDVIEVRCQESEMKMLILAQLWLRRELASMEITIEGNPSSNLIIGDLADLQNHPAFRLMPIDSAANNPTIPVSLNVDNPITFSSCMADEFAHMYYALLQIGIPSKKALKWLKRARQAGWQSRFTLPASSNQDILRSVVGAWSNNKH